jgi:hypothetical protein
MGTSNSQISLNSICEHYNGETPPIHLSSYYSQAGIEPGMPLSYSSMNIAMFGVTTPYGKPHTCIRNDALFHVFFNPLRNWMNEGSNTTPIIDANFSNFFYYNYEDGDPGLSNTIDQVYDGMDDMFDGGNYITVSSECIGDASNNIYEKVPYGNVLTEPTHGVYVSQPFTYPHLSMVYIQNDTVSLIGHGNVGSDESAAVSNIGVQSYETSNARFGSIWTNMNGNAGDPSIMDVWFTITHSNWNSTIGSIQDNRKTEDANDYSHSMAIGGCNFILCKALIGLSNGALLEDPAPMTNFITSFVQAMPLTITQSNLSTNIRSNVSIVADGDD